MIILRSINFAGNSIHQQMKTTDCNLGYNYIGYRLQLLLHLKLVATQLGEVAELFLVLGMNCGTDCTTADDPLYDFISLLGWEAFMGWLHALSFI